MKHIILTYQVEEGGFWAEVASEKEFVIGKVKVAAVVYRQCLKVGNAKMDDITPLATLWASTSSLLDPVDSPKIPKR